MQAAQKTLAVIGGNILQQAIGNSPITEGKIEAFIHTQPGIMNDPKALQRITCYRNTLTSARWGTRP